MTTRAGVAYSFGGVCDEETEEAIKGQFYNDLFTYKPFISNAQPMLGAQFTKSVLSIIFFLFLSFFLSSTRITKG